MFGLKKPIVMGICSVGVPSSIQNLLNVTGMTLLNNLTSFYGSDAVAAMGIAQKINMIPLYVALGLSQGIMPLVSYNYASGNHKRMKEAITFSLKISAGFMAAISCFYYIGSRPLISLFMKNSAIVSYGAAFLHGLCLSLTFLCIDFLAVGVFQACGMGKKAFIFALLRKIVLEIPALVLLNKIFPLYGLAYAQFITEVVLSIAAAVTLQKIFHSANLQKTL